MTDNSRLALMRQDIAWYRTVGYATGQDQRLPFSLDEIECLIEVAEAATFVWGNVDAVSREEHLLDLRDALARLEGGVPATSSAD